MSAIVVQDNVAIPPKWTPEGNASFGKAPKYPWATMKVGQSFFVPLPKGRSFTAHASQMKNHPEGGKFESRRLIEDGTHGVRVWRTK